MMKRIFLSFLVSAFLFGGVISSARAQVQNQPLSEEAIVSYDSDVRVNTDNSIDVTETITYNTGPLEHHGIYRDIYPYSSQKRKMSFENLSVVDESGKLYAFQTHKEGGNFRIKIGDADVAFTGQKTYVLRYHATQAVGQLENFDEIYWNVTGNDWAMPIKKAQVSVTLPDGTMSLQSSCYFGVKGSVSQCQMTRSSGNTYTFAAPGVLNASEGITVAVGFPKGIVMPYPPQSKMSVFFATYGKWMVVALLPILTFILSMLSWYSKGRDDRETRVIIPQYDIYGDLTPMEVSGIVEEKVDTSQISAEIIYLATKGYVKIHQIEEKVFGFFKTTDYELIKLKDFSDLPNEFDKKLLKELFASGDTVKLSSLKNVFYKHVEKVVDLVLNALKEKKYYKNLGRMKYGKMRLFLLIFFSIWASGMFGGLLGTTLFDGNPLPVMASIFSSIIIYGAVSHFNPSKTVKGVEAKEYILGLKEYLRIAEKNRLEFHNAPEKKPEIFEKLLPYAMALGVADIWAEEFKDIYTIPPSWYVGPSSNSFNATAFNHSMANFSSFATSSLASSPSNSGSGGGGSSGGGGGGGGGGSW